MPKSFLVSLNLNKNELQNATIQNLATAPSSPNPGQIYYDTTLNMLGYWDNYEWIYTNIRSVVGTAPIVAITDASGNVTISINPATGSTAGSLSAAFFTLLNNATSSNTASTIVERDSSGNFSAGIITVAGSGSSSGLTLNGTVTNPTDAATKAYVDASSQGLSIKDSVQVKTTGNITLSGLQTIDGYTTLVGDRVAVFNQITGTQSGLYLAASGAWARTVDFASGTHQDGSFFFVENGTLNANTGWVVNTPGPNDVVGTNTLTVTQFSGAGTYTANNGLTLTGTQFNVVAGDNSLSSTPGSLIVKEDPAGAIVTGSSGVKVQVDGTLTIASNTLGVTKGLVARIYTQNGVSIGTTPGIQTITHNLNSKNVVVSVCDSTTNAEYELDVVHATVNTITINATGPTLTVYVTVIG
jgi:hypothetical protein